MSPGILGIAPSDFLQHLASDRGSSVYTQRNYRQALLEFSSWYGKEHGTAPVWAGLTRDVFRSYLRSLGRRGLSPAACRLRFSALCCVAIALDV